MSHENSVSQKYQQFTVLTIESDETAVDTVTDGKD